MRLALLPCLGAILVLFCCAQSLAAPRLCQDNAVRVVPRIGPPVCVTVPGKRLEDMR